jgi:hypothetical protein
MKMCFKHRTKMKVDHELKILKLCRIVFLSHRLWCFMNFFGHEFSMFGHAHIFVFIIVVYTHLKMLHKWFSSRYVWLCEKKLLKILRNQKKKNVVFSLVVFKFFFRQFCLVMLKMVTNCFGNRNFMYSMKRLKGGLVFFFWILGGKGDGERISFVFSLFTNVFPLCSIKFPKCSQCVP